MDKLTKTQRSDLMRRISGDHLKPEESLRRALRKVDLKFKRNDRSLPGSPDLAFPKSRLAVFVHGCFWHGHAGCYRAPKTNGEFWAKKLGDNIRRDARARRRLNKMGWGTLTVWECDIKRSMAACVSRIARVVA
jgi:DNA mismatch endonuclease (patch repair protein)